MSFNKDSDNQKFKCYVRNYMKFIEIFFCVCLIDFKCECLALADDFTLLLVVENPGTLHLLHLPTCKLIWSFVSY